MVDDGEDKFDEKSFAPEFIPYHMEICKSCKDKLCMDCMVLAIHSIRAYNRNMEILTQRNTELMEKADVKLQLTKFEKILLLEMSHLKAIIEERRQVRLAKTKMRLTRKQRWEILKTHDTCENCGVKQTLAIELEIHHIIPVSKGGSNDRNNLMILCQECHRLLRTDILVKRQGENSKNSFEPHR